jgi:hypothetical protein
MEQSMLRIMAVHLGWAAAELKRQNDQVALACRMWRAFESSPCPCNVHKAVSAKAKNDHVLNQTLSGFLRSIKERVLATSNS